MLETGWRIRPGLSYPLGATVTPDGVNFALYSRGAERVELCLFDDPKLPERLRVDLPVRTGYVWHGFLSDIAAGQLYGYRVHGPFDPSSGRRFNPAKLLIDPYARAIAGSVDWDATPKALVDGNAPNSMDDSHAVPKSIVWADDFDWEDDAPPATPWQDTVIYETHVKGFSVQHPDVPPALRGSYLGLASEAAIAHFTGLGVTAVELLPVTACMTTERVHRQGLTNYWGYDPIAFFAPDARFSASGDRGGQVNDFKSMVRNLHRHGLEVILDIVVNHSGESSENAATLSFRGIDNSTYYRLDPMNPARYLNFTGTGNAMNVHERPVIRLILDCLRYWVQEMHVDGFRLDLATTLARGELDFDARSSFLDAVYQDPVLSRVKLIVEPWDIGPGGYQTGSFPAPFSEWNDWFRDGVRRYWRGDEGHASQLARRLMGSPDLYATGERGPAASINFVTCHDGFTLQDLVSYANKHNARNGESNRDGTADNHSHNFGVEGPTDDPVIVAVREQQKRNFLATLLFSQGVPMLLGGDEIGRTQLGNNNAFNQDNPTSWYDWDMDEHRCDLFQFTCRLTAIRRSHPSLRQTRFLEGSSHESGPGHLRWLKEDGQEMTSGDWAAPWYRCFGLHLPGNSDDLGPGREVVEDDALLLLFNAAESAIDFLLPPGTWSLVVDTAHPGVLEDTESYSGGRRYKMASRSLTLFRARRHT